MPGGAQEQHEVVTALKEIAQELGRVPRALDLVGTKLSRYRVELIFGTWSEAIKAAGMEPVKRGAKPNVFEKPLEPHLEAQHARQDESQFSNFILPIENYPSTAVIGDMHEPFAHSAAKRFALEVIRELKPKRAVQVGDVRDMFSWQKYPRSHNVFLPKEEIELGTAAIGAFWKDVQEASPGIECFQLFGNHDIRPYSRVLEAFPALESLIDLRPLYRFPGVQLIEDPRQELQLDGVFFHHGYMTKAGANRDFMNVCTAVGHSHRAGAFFRTIWGGHQIWELNAGTLGDPKGKGLTYTPQRHTQQTLGLGWIDRLGPRFIPFQPRRS
jgi:hypothetical protein